MEGTRTGRGGSALEPRPLPTVCTARPRNHPHVQCAANRPESDPRLSCHPKRLVRPFRPGNRHLHARTRAHTGAHGGHQTLPRSPPRLRGVTSTVDRFLEAPGVHLLEGRLLDEARRLGPARDPVEGLKRSLLPWLAWLGLCLRPDLGRAEGAADGDTTLTTSRTYQVAPLCSTALEWQWTCGNLAFRVAPSQKQVLCPTWDPPCRAQLDLPAWYLL